MVGDMNKKQLSKHLNIITSLFDIRASFNLIHFDKALHNKLPTANPIIIIIRHPNRLLWNFRIFVKSFGSKIAIERCTTVAVKYQDKIDFWNKKDLKHSMALVAVI